MYGFMLVLCTQLMFLAPLINVSGLRFSKKKQEHLMRGFSNGEPLKTFNSWFQDDIQRHQEKMYVTKSLQLGARKGFAQVSMIF